MNNGGLHVSVGRAKRGPVSAIAVATAVALAGMVFSACSNCANGQGASGKAAADPASEATAHDGTPKIAVEQPVFDFGKVKEGADVEHIFKIQNRGGAELVIERASGS